MTQLGNFAIKYKYFNRFETFIITKIVKFSSPESAECTALYEDDLPVEPEPLPQLDPPGKMLRNISEKFYLYFYKSNEVRFLSFSHRMAIEDVADRFRKVLFD